MQETAAHVVAVGTAGAALPAVALLAAPSLEEALARDPEAVLVGAGELRRILSESAEGKLSELRHALNNDLTAVLGFSQLLLARRTELPEPLVKRVERIYEHATKMSVRIAKSQPV